MDAEGLLVHNGSEGECAERFQTGLIYALGILMLAYLYP